MGFNFRDTDIRLEICGEIYSIPATNGLAETAKAIGTELKALGEGISDESDVDAVCDKCAGFVDRLLGYGANDKIFSGREKNIYDYIDLLTYISNGITSFARQRTLKNKPYHNRKKRR